MIKIKKIFLLVFFKKNVCLIYKQKKESKINKLKTCRSVCIEKTTTTKKKIRRITKENFSFAS